MEVNELNLLSILLEYCKENGLNAEQTLLLVAEGNRYDKVHDLKVELKKRRVSCLSREKSSKSDAVNGEQRKFLLWARTLHQMLGIPMDKFNIPNNQNYANASLSSISDGDYKILKLKYDDGTEESKKKFSEDYLNVTSDAISQMTNDLTVYDYLEKLNYHSPYYLAPYFDAHEKIYARIEEKLKQDFSYTRFLALPKRFLTEQFIKDECSKKKYTYSLASAFDHCSLPLFKHICNCLSNFSEKFKRNENGLYLVVNPPRTYHWGIIDGGKYVVSEYYRYDKDDVCKPDVIFIDKLSKENSKLLEIYENEKKGLLRLRPDRKDHNHLIEFDQEFGKAITAIYKFAEFHLEETLSKHQDKSSNKPLYAEIYFNNTKEKYEHYKKIVGS